MTERIELSYSLMGPGQSQENIDLISKELQIPYPKQFIVSDHAMEWEGKLAEKELSLKGPLPPSLFEHLVDLEMPILFDFFHTSEKNKILCFYGIFRNKEDKPDFLNQDPSLYYVCLDEIGKKEKKFFEFESEPGMKTIETIIKNKEKNHYIRKISYESRNKIMDSEEFKQLCNKLSCAGKRDFRTIPKGMRIIPCSEEQEDMYLLYFSGGNWIAKEMEVSDLTKIISN